MYMYVNGYLAQWMPSPPGKPTLFRAAHFNHFRVYIYIYIYIHIYIYTHIYTYNIHTYV